MRWDPQRDPDPFFDESAVLYCTYYNMQIQIHRPFISRASVLSFPSLALCTNAARSCARLLEVRNQRGPITYFGMAVSVLSGSLEMDMLIAHTWDADGGIRVRNRLESQHVD